MIKNLDNKNSNIKGKKQKNYAFSISFHGVRGTLPTPGRKTLKYGGNTSCIEVKSEKSEKNKCIFFDAGTGIVEAGDKALKKGINEFHIFFTHYHYDHIIGLTKFAPLFKKNCKIFIYGQKPPGGDLPSLIRHFFTHPLFPLDFDFLISASSINFQTLNLDSTVIIDNLKFTFSPLNHPQGALALKATHQDTKKSIVYATDHEEGTKLDESLQIAAKHSSLLITDTTFLKDELIVGWGHSTSYFASKLAKKAKTDALALFHFEPSMSDSDLEKKLLKEATDNFKQTFLSREGYCVDILKITNGWPNASAFIKKIASCSNNKS